jgi:hypothetical protein
MPFDWNGYYEPLFCWISNSYLVLSSGYFLGEHWSCGLLRSSSFANFCTLHTLCWDVIVTLSLSCLFASLLCPLDSFGYVRWRSALV